MTIEHPIEDEVTQLARRVSKARGRLAYQFDPALTEALSEDELHAERDLAERIRVQDRDQRWKQAQAAAAASDRARQTTEQIEKADIRDLLLARKAIAAQRRESSPHAKLASLYRHRSWSLRALAGVVAAGMCWSAVNVQHNIAPGGPDDPLYWFSYLLEGMISVCLIIIMTGTNKVAEWGVVDNRRQVAAAEVALLALTVTLNTYPYLRTGRWYDAAVHAVAPVMIGVALLIHDAASMRYGLAIARATEQIRDLPDPAEQIRRAMPKIGNYRLGAPADMATWGSAPDEFIDDELPPRVRGVDRRAAPDVEPLVQVDNVAVAPTAVAPMEDAVAPVRSNGRSAAPVSTEKQDAPTIVERRPVKPTPTAAPEPHVAPEIPASVELPGSDLPAVASMEWLSVPAESDNGRAVLDVTNGKESSITSFDTEVSSLESYAAKVDKALQSVYVPDSTQDTGQFRVAEILEQELADLQAERRRARSSKQ